MSDWDIVDLLRSGEFLETQLTGNGHSFISTPSPSVRKAADTIEALRAENARLREALNKAAVFLAIASSQTGSEPLAKAAKNAARAALGDTK